MTERGLLIAFEGGDGSGKSTQAAVLAQRLNAVLTKQAGGTPFGQRVRELTLDDDTAHVSERAEALLYMADRAEHVEKVVEPALAAGRHVVTDRYAYSTFVYQGYVGGLDVDELRSIADWSMSGLWPDLVILLSVEPSTGQERRVARGGDADHYELADDEVHRLVNASFVRLATDDRERWRVINGDGAADEVAERVWSAVSPFLVG